jgi:hypothetical protein
LHDGAWRKRLPSGKMASLPGFAVTVATLDPDSAAPDNAAWRLRVTLQQWEPYVVPVLTAAGADSLAKPRTTDNTP